MKKVLILTVSLGMGHNASAKAIEDEFNVRAILDSNEVAKFSDILFLAIKPNIFKDVLVNVRDNISKDTIIVSIAAGITIDNLEEWLEDDYKIVRTMPNVAALVGESISAICSNKRINQEELEEVCNIFNMFGKCETLEEVYSTLEGARQAYVKTAIPTTGNSFDMTFLMTNPQVTSATGWINGGTASGQQYTGAPDETYLDFYQVTRDMYQTLSGLPSGSYSVKAATRGHAEVTTGYIYVQNGENKLTKDIHKVGNEGNTLGNGWDWTTTDAIAVTDGHLTIGFYAECGSGQWVGADVFSLYRAYDASLAAPMQASVTSLKSDAQALVGKVMGATENAALIAAIDGANASSTNPFALDAMIIALSSAIADAEVSIADYEKIATYIAKANSISTSIAASYQIQYTNRTISESAERVYQNLEVATYNYVTTNFTYPVELEADGWVPTGPVGSLSGQHYDGTSTSSYLEQSGAAWGSDAWEISYKYEKTLPAGKYVFKVAGRRASGTGNTMSLQVTDIDDPENPIELGSVSDFPEGDTGLGINRKGEASFDANDVAGFALDGQGRGWQWRYVKFELDSETTVQVAVNAAATILHQWMSFCEATVQMTEETYLEANKGGLDAPTAAANALVDTKPMGTEENNALKAALAMTYNTGAGLLAKVNALETAVAKAKAWVAVYYEAKAPLVAQLERFEADFNLEGDIDHAYMKNGLWSDVIEKVKVAALAKDDLTSHEVLTEAANNLQATLDAAQASIDAYNALKIEIKSAKNYTPIVTENVAGHTADLGEAESGYNNASIETARANELTAALQNYRVEDYNYVVENFGEIKLINEWTGQTNTNKGEHWSGDDQATYFDYSLWSGEGLYEATNTIILPAGQYFLMAAGRAADVEGTEAYIKVGDAKAIFPTKSSYGRGIATDGTATFASYADYARNNEGFGWEYRVISFTLDTETEVELIAGMAISNSWNPLSWAGVCTPTLYTAPLVAAKENLKNTINHAQTMYPVGDGAFQVDANCDAYQSLSSAISTAQGVLDSSDNIDELEEATESLNEPIENYKNGYVLNAPAEGMAYNIVMSAAWEHEGKAVTYLANDRKDQGLYNIKYHEAPNVNYAQAFTFTAVEGKTNCFTLSMNDVDGNQRYVCTGVPYEGDANQIRTTTDAAQALVVKVIATTREGIYQLWNTEAENYLGGQDAGFFTVNSHTTFRLQEAAKANVTLTLSKVGWATLILPFNAELPEGVKAYSCGEADGETLTLVEAESLKANTPYLMNGYESKHNFSGYGLADKDSYTDGLFVGTYENYKTTANSNTYVLQKKGDEAAFYLVGEGEGAQPTVGAYRCYMVYEGAAGAPKFSFGRGQGTTSIDNMESTDNGQQTIVIYDLMGRKVDTMEKGGIYIVNGKKVIVK